MAENSTKCTHEPHDPTEPTGTIRGQMDPAGESLADALRVSFRLLTAIMVFVAIAFILSGFASIKPQEVGIKKVFGRIVGTAEAGLAYTWPFPVGQIEVVNVSEQNLAIEDLWMHETAAEKTQAPSERRVVSEGLRPGWDGALLTGDRSLLHVKLTCNYEISGAEGAVACQSSIQNLEETIRSAVCKAAILAAANRTADAIQRTEKREFVRDVKKTAQDLLNDLTGPKGRPFEAVRIKAIVLNDTTWPVRTLAAYRDAQRAVSEKEQIINLAFADARKILNEAVGASHETLVGAVEELMVGEKAGASKGRQSGRGGLIQEYADQSDPTEQAKILARIEDVLLTQATGGEASRMLAGAQGYRTQVVQSAESRAKRFNELLKEFEGAPQFMLERLWSDARDEILDSPTVEKVFLTTGNQKTVWVIPRDATIRKEVRRELLKLQEQKEEGSNQSP